jgi:hypothetical protein
VQQLNKLSLKEQKKKFDKDLDELEERLQHQHQKYNKYLKPQVYKGGDTESQKDSTSAN